MTAILRPARLFINYRAIGRNARLLREFYGRDTAMMAVVKADAYGHGAVPSAREILRNGADRLAVAMVDEAIELREAGIEAPILVLGGASGEAVFEAVRLGAELLLQDRFEAEEMKAAAKRYQRPALAHIKLDTGMTRLGVRTDEELKALLEAIGSDGSIAVTGAFTHYYEPLDRAASYAQHERFLRFVSMIRAAGHNPLVHGAATEASLLYPDLRDDCVRPGIALYGGCAGLLPGVEWAMKLCARAVRLERIEAGEGVGYGWGFRAERPTSVMTVPIGYADGYPRILGGRASALLRGRRVPVIGRVCMDMLMLDVTDVPDARVGDEVVLMGEQGGERVTPDDLAAWAETLSYEIITGFHERIARGDFDDKSGDTSVNTR